MIDTFESTQNPTTLDRTTETPGGGPTGLSGSIVAEDIIGEIRKTYVEGENLYDDAFVHLDVTDGTLHMSKSGAIGSWETSAIWQGYPQTPLDIDITEGGQSNQFALDLGPHTGGGELTLFVADINGNISSAIITLPDSSATGGIYHVLFSDLIVYSAAAPDLTHTTIFSISYHVNEPNPDSPTPSDYSLSINDLRVIPEPTTASLFVLSTVCLAGRRRRRL